jgi:hypothetical protein
MLIEPAHVSIPPESTTSNRVVRRMLKVLSPFAAAGCVAACS